MRLKVSVHYVIVTVEVRLNRAIDEIKAVEDEKRENAVSEERRISAELRATIDELRAVSLSLGFHFFSVKWD